MFEPIVRPFLNSPNDQNMVLQDENARLHLAGTIKEYKNHQHMASLPHELYQALLEKWERIPRETRMKLVISMSSRRQVVIRQRGNTRNLNQKWLSFLWCRLAFFSIFCKWMVKTKSLENKIFTVLVFSEKLCSVLVSGMFLLKFYIFMGNFLCAATALC